MLPVPESLLAPRLPGAAQGELITVRQSFLSDDGGTRNTSSLTVNVSSVSASSMMYVCWTAAASRPHHPVVYVCTSGPNTCRTRRRRA